MAALGLEGRPAADDMPLAMGVWMESVLRRRAMDPETGAHRIRRAFDELITNVQRWPPPSQLLAILNRADPVHHVAQPRLEPPGKRAAEAKAFADIAKTLGLNQPETQGETAP